MIKKKVKKKLIDGKHACASATRDQTLYKVMYTNIYGPESLIFGVIRPLLQADIFTKK